jgi:DNA damage-inducible protein 1
MNKNLKKLKKKKKQNRKLQHQMATLEPIVTTCTHCSFDNESEGKMSCEMCGLPLSIPTPSESQTGTFNFNNVNLLPPELIQPPKPVETPEQKKKREKENRIEDNYILASENIPESFAQAPMLFIYGNINGHTIPIFIDSGAQMTIMSRKTAIKCGLDDFIDDRYQGMAVGVGQQKITGRIYAQEVLIGDYEEDGEIKIESAISILCPFTILDDGPEEIIFGIDQLHLHQINLNFKNKVIELGDHKIKFLDPARVDKIKSMRPQRDFDKKKKTKSKSKSKK